MNRRQLIKDFGVVAAASPFVLVGTSEAQSPVVRANVLVTYHSVTGNTQKMADGVVEGANSIHGTSVVLKRVSEVTAEDLLSTDAVIVGSPVYFGNMAGEVKTFFDNWLLKFDFYREFKMRNKIGAAFATGGSISNGKEITMMAILEAMLINKLLVVSAGGSFGLGASATTGPESPGIDEKELAAARDLGKRVAEVAIAGKRA